MASQKALKLGFLDIPRTVFLVIDIQEGFRGYKYFKDMLVVANKMADGAKVLNVPLYVSEQYPKGLGRTAKEFKIQNASLVYEKSTFSMRTPELVKQIEKDVPAGLQAVVMCGLEAHVCVEQSAMAFLQEDIAVHILADGCISRSQQDRILALRRLENYGCHITTYENVLFKLMKTKDHPEFKTMLKLFKDASIDTLGMDSVQSKL